MFYQAVHDCHERPGLGFFGHDQSFDPGRRRVNRLVLPPCVPS
jgi:hypothetical protein